jgi:hypothetical protein
MKILRLEKKTFSPLWFGCPLALFFTAVLAACTQDPTFAMIAREVKPREPLIKGVPTKMVIFDYDPGDYALYIGAASLHRYRRGIWDMGNVPQPPGAIIDMAATRTYLYILTGADSPELYRLAKNAPSWEQVSFGDTEFPRLQAVYGEIDNGGRSTTNYLFVGASKRSFSRDDTKDYAVFYIEDGQDFQPTAARETALLTGAVYDGAHHYVSTSGDGIYQINGVLSPGVSCLKITGEENVRGIIRVDPAILAFCYGGDILKIEGSGTITLNSNSPGQYFRGPAAVWRASPSSAPDILLATVITPDSTYGPTYGYREINIKSGPVVTAVPGEIALREPGNGIAGFPSTMDDNKRYKDSIESKPVNCIFQVPYDIDPDMPLFASVQGTGTMKNDTDGGLWSYRERDGVPQWNAE